jgi:hypothetical protein
MIVPFEGQDPVVEMKINDLLRGRHDLGRGEGNRMEDGI